MIASKGNKRKDRSPPIESWESEVSYDICKVVYAEWEHYKQRCRTTWAIPGAEFPVDDNTMDHKLEHCEVCDEYSQPQTFLEDDSVDYRPVTDIGTYHIMNVFKVSYAKMRHYTKLIVIVF